MFRKTAPVCLGLNVQVLLSLLSLHADVWLVGLECLVTRRAEKTRIPDGFPEGSQKINGNLCQTVVSK